MRIFTALLLMLVGIVVLGQASFAQSSVNSTLQQQILAFECSYTTVETGLGRVHDSSCPPFAPIIEIIDTNWGRPIITGIYDAVHTEELRVFINGRWFVLGVDDELSANGNVWVLDLRGSAEPLSLGSYQILVEAVGDDGVVRVAEASMVVSVSDNETEIPEPVEPSGELPFPEQYAVQTSVLPLFVVLSFVSLGILLIVAKRRRKEEEDEWARYYAIMHSKASEWPSTTSPQEEQE